MYVLGYTGFSHAGLSGHRRPLGGLDSLFRRDVEPQGAATAALDQELPFTLFPLGYFGHDSAAALVKDGRLIACAAEERFTRAKFALNLAGRPLLPRLAVQYCLEAGRIGARDIDVVAHYCNFTDDIVKLRLERLRPFLSTRGFERVAHSYREVFGHVLSVEAATGQFAEMTGTAPRLFHPVRHHRAHAASAFYPSGFDEALILVLDAYGELESSSYFLGRRDSIEELDATLVPYSMGVLYLLTTVYLGFRSLGDEYKVMGLASYGNPSRFRPVFRRLFDAHQAPPVLLDANLEDYLIRNLGPGRKPDEPVGDRHADIAAALQEGLAESVLASLHRMRALTGAKRLCMAGGVALNCSMNGRIARSGLFGELFVQPAAGDDGASVGAAYEAYAATLSSGVPPAEAWAHVYWGPEFPEEELLAALHRFAAVIDWRRCEDIAAKAAAELASGSILGWYQGRMEWGPRALGNRSILADPRRPELREVLNARVKLREAFRPFAPSVIEEAATDYFDMSGIGTSPYMLFTVPVRADRRALIPAVTHVDGTARVQTVSKATNPLYWRLLQAFGKCTGLPVLLNTSFNSRNQPIVCSPDDALSCLLATKLDGVALGPFLVTRRH